jgi:hypothetical protein
MAGRCYAFVHSADTPASADCSGGGLAGIRLATTSIGLYLPTPEDPIAALADSHRVFQAQVIKVREPQPELRWSSSFPYIQYNTPFYGGRTITLALEAIWRGDREAELTLTTGRPYSGCGVDFQVGERYLVYAYINGAGNLMTHRCSRTVQLSYAGEDLALFGPGEPPLPADDAPIAWVILPTGVALLALAGWWWRRAGAHRQARQ